FATGRTFAANEDRFGENDVAVISYELWQQLFAGDPGVTGRTLRLDGALFTIVGVAPPNFDYPAKTNIWIPTVFNIEKVPKRGAFLVQTIGRLRPGVSVGLAKALYQEEVGRANPR